MQNTEGQPPYLRACLIRPPTPATGCKLYHNTRLRETSAPNGDSARVYSRANYVFQGLPMEDNRSC